MPGYQLLKTGNRRHRFFISQDGRVVKSKTFVDKDVGKKWARQEESAIDATGLPLNNENLMKVSVSELVNEYIDGLDPKTRGGYKSTVATLRKFLSKSGLATKKLAEITTKDAAQYRNKRYKEVKSTTVAKEIRALHRVFELARKEGGYPNLNNPFKVELNGVMYRRERRLEEGEFESLLSACNGCYGLNKIYVPMAFLLTIETGMRMDEIFNLKWEDFNTKTRRIRITKSKTDKSQDRPGRTIVMSVLAKYYALYLQQELKRLNTHFLYSKPLLFGDFDKHAFEQSFKRARHRAKLQAYEGETLQFRDLRREAASRWEDMELTRAENDLMRGKIPKGIDGTYIRGKLAKIEEKLDAYFLKEHHAPTIDDAFIMQPSLQRLRPELLKAVQINQGIYDPADWNEDGSFAA